ncbi:MAG: 2-dehydro-3-deoxygalactonokinase [Paracoccaceae bacterium]
MSATDTIPPDWIAVDWGTSHLRATRVAADGKILEKRRSEQGMGRLQPQDFEPALLEQISDWLNDTHTTKVVCCGMVGARQGWVEAPYQTVPCAPISTAELLPIRTNDPQIEVHIIPGIKQMKPADVMRGEETQAAGFLASEPDFDGVICLPGTHSKWMHISAGEIVSFASYMTGELFGLLASQSVLRHSVAETGWHDDSFLQAVDDAISKPAAVSARLFTLRAENLIGSLSPEHARSRLSGMLIGLELAASRPYWLGRNVALGQSGQPGQAYRLALQAQGMMLQFFDAEEVTLDGLAALHSKLSKSGNSA